MIYEELIIDRFRLEEEANFVGINLLYTFLVLFLCIVTLFIYVALLRKRRAEANRRLVKEREESNVRILQTQSAERQRLARDLHDDMGSYLSSISVMSQSVVNLAQTDPQSGLAGTENRRNGPAGDGFHGRYYLECQPR